jgi:hypothetical protein
MNSRYNLRNHFLYAVTVCLWLCATADARVWHVSVKKLPGIESEPTIAQAAANVEVGDTIIIHSGIYREKVLIDRGGQPNKPITLEAAVGADVVMTGADRLSEWTKTTEQDRIATTTWFHRFASWTPNGTHPSDDYHLLIGRCEQVFVNGYPLRQVLKRDQLARGTFYIDLEGRRLYLWSRDNQDIKSNKTIVEASSRDGILIIKGDHVVIKGIRFRYAANRAQQGAVRFAGSHLTVSDCVFEYTNSSGAEFTGTDITVQRCTFQYNGQLGFGANRAHRLLMTGCTVRNNNIKGFNRGWEAGGNKICLTRGAVLEKSIFVENRGNGIWFDIGNEDCTVRNCLIASNEDAGIFYEISYGLHAHDNVIVNNGLADTAGAWGANAGISISSSPDCLIERNLLLGNKEGFAFREQARSTPRIDSRRSEPIWNHDSTIRNNTIAYNRDAQTWGWFDVSDNRHWPAKIANDAEALCLEKLLLTFKDNLYYADAGQGLFNWGVAWKKCLRYSSLEQVRAELNLEQGSVLAPVMWCDFWALDLRVPAGSKVMKMDCYPRGDIPGVRLGICGP